MKIYNSTKQKYVNCPNKIIKFMDEYELLCKKYNLSLSHEDSHGGFIIDDYKKTNVSWVRSAFTYTKTLLNIKRK